MRRRDFIIFLAGAMAVWPLAVLAQQKAMPVIGYLNGTTPEAHAEQLAAFRQGLVTNVLNPKVGLFFLAFLPQFVTADAMHATYGFLLLGLTFVATGTAWVLVLAVAAASVRRFFERRRAAQALLSRAMGGVFVYLGVRLAMSER